ncbi:hypothetical protein TUMEXPCC7403_02720 [Tumidithrix helvetica PCC 7403]|uniref:hypothetical protein n=1 Tax=Tumidithrix helvetica TaxID=3457545 RepID=UPI003CBB1E26
MKPNVILIETNWVVDIIAPAHLQSPQVVELLARAEAGEFELHIPAICLAEARETIPRRYAPKSRSDDFRKFVTWAKNEGKINTQDVDAARRIFDKFDGLVKGELMKVPERLRELANHPNLKVFALSQPMLERQVSIGAMDLELKPFDLAILAALLVRAEDLQQEGLSWIGFCELDSDLQPWDRSGAPKSILSDLYNTSRIWVYADFQVEDVDELPED